MTLTDEKACARTATAQIERKHQIKVSRNTTHVGQLPDALQERITNIESHLNGEIVQIIDLFSEAGTFRNISEVEEVGR